jgi:methyltransferase (TIGR00027 family)
VWHVITLIFERDNDEKTIREVSVDNNQASKTAQMTAYCRWHHTRHDSSLIFEDHLAGEILSDQGRDDIESLLLTGLERFNPTSAAAFPDRQSAIAWMMQAGASSSIVLSRARYAEEMLERAIAAGASQYVILGAGLDTFAFRRPELLGRISVFEVDHPASQEYKRRRIRELGWECPANLHFVAVDFARNSLSAELERSAFDPDRQAFFSWLGVSYYLNSDQVMATLRQIPLIAPPGSSLVFDYLDTAAYLSGKAAPRVVRMLASVREIGEPMLSGFDAYVLADELAGCGFELQENLGPCDIQLRYFMGRTDHHRACEHVHFALATVK